MLDITTHAVWSAIPYSARRALVLDCGNLEEELTAIADHMGWESKLDAWTVERIQVTPWSLLPAPVRRLIHAQTTCQTQEEEA